MTGMARVMAAEFGEFGITVNNVAPGMVLSPMTRDAYGSMEVQIEEQVRAGSVVQPHRLATEDEIAQALLYFCGPNTDQVTGMTLHVNAGTVMP